MIGAYDIQKRLAFGLGELNAWITARDLKNIGWVVIKRIHNDAYFHQLLNGKRHKYLSEQYMFEKAHGMWGNANAPSPKWTKMMAKRQIEEERRRKERFKNIRRGEKTTTKSGKVGVKRKGKLSIDKDYSLGRVQQSRQVDYVDMTLTGRMWKTFKPRRFNIKQKDYVSVIVGFDESEKHKIQKADKLGREVLALTDKNAEIVAREYARRKWQRILRHLNMDKDHVVRIELYA